MIPGTGPEIPDKDCCDVCLMRGWRTQDSRDHALVHCMNGEHCASQSASCAASYGVRDHSILCCTCKGKWYSNAEGFSGVVEPNIHRDHQGGGSGQGNIYGFPAGGGRHNQEGKGSGPGSHAGSSSFGNFARQPPTGEPYDQDSSQQVSTRDKGEKMTGDRYNDPKKQLSAREMSEVFVGMGVFILCCCLGVAAILLVK